MVCRETGHRLQPTGRDAGEDKEREEKVVTRAVTRARMALLGEPERGTRY